MLYLGSAPSTHFHSKRHHYHVSITLCTSFAFLCLSSSAFVFHLYSAFSCSSLNGFILPLFILILPISVPFLIINPTFFPLSSSSYSVVNFHISCLVIILDMFLFLFCSCYYCLYSPGNM